MAERVLFVADSDSNVKFATAFGAHLAQDGMTSDVILVADGAAPLVQAGAAVGAAGTDIRVVASLDALFADRALLGYDVIFVLITGRLVRDFCVDLNLLALGCGAPKPVTIGGFIGEWISGEAQVEERGALDVFVVNREDELRLFEAICARGGHDGRLVALPYGFLIRHGFAKPLPPRFDYDLTTTILFADQVQVPRTDAERLSLYEGLEALAKASPERNILFCTREVAGGVTSHRAKGDITDHFTPKRLARVPNLIVERGTLRRRLAEAELVLSVSSTAGVEALINGVPALFLRGYSDSGAEKFENSGLLIDLAELRQPKTFAPAKAIYAAARADVWDRFSELVRAQPTLDARATEGKPAVPRGSVAPGSPASLIEELLRRTPGVSGVEALPAALSVAALDLAASLAALDDAPADYVAQFAVSDAPRLAPAEPAPTIVVTTQSGYVARAEIALRVREVALHVPARLAAEDELVVVIGETGRVVGRGDGEAVVFETPDGIAASLASYATAAGAVSVIRLSAETEINVQSVTLSRPAGALPPAWIACEPRIAFTRLGVLAPRLTPERAPIPAHQGRGQVVVLRFEHDAPDHAGPLLTFDGDDGSTLAIKLLFNGALSLELAVGGDVLGASAPVPGADVTLTIVSAPSRTVVVANGWTHAFATPFRPSGLRIDARPGQGLSTPLFAAFGAAFSDAAAAAIAERIVGRNAETAPAEAATDAASAETTRVLGPYLDLVGADDLVAAMAVVDGLRSPLAYAERYLRAGDNAKAFAVSAICADRTPTSKAHLLICAEALAALGAPDRAEPFLRRAERLVPRDPRVKATAALVRGRGTSLSAMAKRLRGAFKRPG